MAKNQVCVFEGQDFCEKEVITNPFVLDSFIFHLFVLIYFVLTKTPLLISSGGVFNSIQKRERDKFLVEPDKL